MINKYRGRGRPASGVATVSRDEVLRAAFGVFIDVEYDAATIRELARAAGVSAALLNHLFGSKEALWFEAVEAVYGALHRQQMSALAIQGEMGEKVGIKQALKTLLLELLAEPGLLGFLYREGEQQNRRGAYLRKNYLEPMLDQLWEIFGPYSSLSDRAAFEVLLVGVPRMLVFPQLLQERHRLLGDSAGLLIVAQQVIDRLSDIMFESQP